MRNLVKPRMDTRTLVIRYPYAIVSVLLKNIWITLLWMYFAPVKGRPRTIDIHAFQFNYSIVIIRKAIWTLMEVVKRFPILRYPI